MSPSDHHLLSVAHAGAPSRGVRVTARRGVWKRPGGDWHRFENETTLAGFVGELNDQEVRVYRGEVCLSILLGDVVHVIDDVSFIELTSPPTLAEALELSLTAA